MASGDLAGQDRSPGGLKGWGQGDPLFWNKVSGAILGTLMFALGLNVASGILYTPKRPAVPGYDLPAPEPEAAGASDQQAQAVPLPILLASADAGKGQSAAKKCVACHVFDKGGPNKIGPALYGVVARPKGAHPGFAYSTAMKSKGGEWAYEDLDKFLANPKAYVPGTIMAFAGVTNPKERADTLAYLRSLSDSPVAYPEPIAEPAAATGGAPGPAQTEQRPSLPAPGQRVEPGPAPIQARPQSASPQAQPGAQTQPNPTGDAPAGGQSPAPGAGSPATGPAR